MRSFKYLLALVALGLASCADDVIQPRSEDEKEPIPIGAPPPPNP
ncbi:MAG TPA: hypothetical protein VKZ86_00865 [Cyclobacteriaceae bacterium]|nr:hypothetical protein [Cyclobacteriaceae bacterium]